MHLQRLSSVLVAWTMLFAPMGAHETWAERVILIHYGEPGEQPEAYKPEQITDLSAIAADGSPLTVTARAVGGAAVAVASAVGDPAAVFYTMRLGHYVITGDDWKPATAAEADAAAKSWSGSFTATSILVWHPSLAQPRNRPIELVPLADPAAIAAGGSLPLRAFRDGRPLAGLTIHRGDGAAPLVSDGLGDIAVPVRSGQQVVIGNFEEVAGGRTTGHLAVLSFRRP